MVEIISEAGIGFKEKSRTIYTKCPVCGRDDKFSILKENGSCICYRGSCDFGRKWFIDWMMITLDISRAEAKKMLYSQREDFGSAGDQLVLTFGQQEVKKQITVDAFPIIFPESHMRPIDSPESAEGASYLEKRGIHLALAKKVDIWYSPILRRVILPIKINDKYYGYQGRHIDNVESGLRMRNNEGFRKDLSVMFIDNLKDKDFAILAEGPFDALKFNNVGGYVCTMGKNVSEKQLDLIYSSGIKRLYLAFDEDAANEMTDIAAMSPVDVYKIDIPESCADRCKSLGKKADFGECTFEEAEFAFKNAKSMEDRLLIYLK